MEIASVSSPCIRESVLRDPRHPVHGIADQLRPYLQVIVERFHPERVILFGSYAYGEPSADSDVDLLVVKDIERSPLSEATRIRRAVRPLRKVSNLPLDIMVRAPSDLLERIERGADFHAEIVQNGLVLV